MLEFNESNWKDIEKFIPDLEELRRVVLDDFIWFMNRPMKYKDTKKKIDDYIHHLSLKAHSKLSHLQKDAAYFQKLDISLIELNLRQLFADNDKLRYGKD